MSRKQTVQQVYDAFGRGDVPGVLALMSPDLRWESAPTMPFGDQVGPQAVAQNVFAVLPTLFDGFHLDVTEVLEAEDAVIGRGVYRGTGLRTGAPLAAGFLHLWRFDEDGRIAYFRTYTDTATWRAASGIDQDAAVPAQGTGGTAAAAPAL